MKDGKPVYYSVYLIFAKRHYEVKQRLTRLEIWDAYRDLSEKHEDFPG